MFRRARAKEPSRDVARLASILQPLTISPWSNMATEYLGVPIFVQQHFLVVQDEDCASAVQKLSDAGLSIAGPDRGIHPDILAHVPDPEAVMATIMEGYASLDRAATFFNYPDREEQLVLVPNSFACLPPISTNRNVQPEIVESEHHETASESVPPKHSVTTTEGVQPDVDDADSESSQSSQSEPNDTDSEPAQPQADDAMSEMTQPDRHDARLESRYDVYGNIYYPLEEALIESFVRCALLEDHPGMSTWGMSLTAAVSTMCRYLDIDNDILDHCEDTRAVEWFSEQFGRKHEEKHGPPDYRISKRIGSGKELPIDSRGRLLS